MLHIDVTLIINILNLLQHVLYWNSSINSFCIHSCFVAASYMVLGQFENHDCVNKLNHNKNTQVCMFLHELRHKIQTQHQNEYI